MAFWPRACMTRTHKFSYETQTNDTVSFSFARIPLQNIKLRMHDLEPLFSRRIFRDCLDILLRRGKNLGASWLPRCIYYMGLASNAFGVVAATISDSVHVILIDRLIISDWQTIGWAFRSRKEMLYTISFSRTTLKDSQWRAFCIQTKTEAWHFSFEMSNIQYYSKTQRCRRET